MPTYMIKKEMADRKNRSFTKKVINSFGILDMKIDRIYELTSEVEHYWVHEIKTEKPLEGSDITNLKDLSYEIFQKL